MKTDIQYNPNFELSETHNLVSQSAKDFAKNFILPYYKESVSYTHLTLPTTTIV